MQKYQKQNLRGSKKILRKGGKNGIFIIYISKFYLYFNYINNERC